MIVLDIETSGIEPTKNSILSIGALDFYNPTNQFYAECRVWQGAHITDEALKINGFTLQQIMDKNKPTEVEITEEFFKWILQCPEHTTAGQNPSFDTGFLKASAERHHLSYPLVKRTIDLHSICYFHALRRGIKPPTEKGRSALNSDVISQYVGLPIEPHPHKALNGAKQAAECFSRLIHDRYLFDEFMAYSVPWNVTPSGKSLKK
jgi:DNA polymerase III epsilon subunit-like protein